MSLMLALQLDPTLDLKCLQKAAVPVGWNDSQSASPKVVLVPGDEDTAAGEDADHSEDEEALSQGMVSLLNILKLR